MSVEGIMQRTIVRDPLGWLEEIALDGRGIRWVSRRELWVYDALVARELLRNDGGRMIEHSDFFGSGRRAPSRDVQIALAREAHAILHQHVQNLDCSPFMATLGRRSEWPSAGNKLLLEIMRPVLAAPKRRSFQKALDVMVAGRILSRHEPAAGTVRRMRDRFRFFRAVALEVAASDEAPSGDRDLLDVMAGYRRQLDEATLVQLYAGFVFATVGSIGFALGWALLQAVRNLKTQHHPVHIVLEALRLFPVAWLFHRRVRQPEILLGQRVLPTQTVAISPYAIHRNPVYWTESKTFLPERWSKVSDRSAWLPFGAGDHACVAAGLSVSLASRLLSQILDCDPKIESGDGPPSLGAALAPPRFALNLCRYG